MSSSKIKLNSSKFIINDKSDQFFVKNFGEIFGFNFKLRSLQNCTIQLLDWTSGIFIDNCTNCKIIISPSNGSVFIKNTKNCNISVVAKNIHVDDCENLRIYAYCPSIPIINNSDLINFGPFNAFLPKLKDLFIKADFIKNSNRIIEDMNEMTFEEIGNDGESLYDGYAEEIGYNWNSKSDKNDEFECISHEEVNTDFPNCRDNLLIENTYVILETYDAEENEEVKSSMMKQKMVDEVMSKINAKIENESNIKKAIRLKALEYKREKKREADVYTKLDEINNKTNYTNPWDKVIDHLDLTEHKGTKDVNRMKEVIISRRNDDANK